MVILIFMFTNVYKISMEVLIRHSQSVVPTQTHYRPDDEISFYFIFPESDPFTVGSVGRAHGSWERDVTN